MNAVKESHPDRYYLSHTPFLPIDPGEEFPCIELLTTPPQNFVGLTGRNAANEQMGSKRKFWLHLSNDDPPLLVKYSRSDTGEHWSEKLAAEIADLLNVPHPPVEVGLLDNAPVSLTRSFLNPGETLIHGNELLSQLDASYRTVQAYNQVEHTLLAIHRALREHQLSPPSSSASPLPAFGIFVGYLLLDALIGNTDRHHENWGAIQTPQTGERLLSLAPSYDHASSLGRELQPKVAHELIHGKDQRRKSAYFERIESSLYELGQRKPLSPYDAFLKACEMDGEAASFWRGQIQKLSLTSLLALPPRISEKVMSKSAKEFACFLLKQNYTRLQTSCTL